ncbi:hypothetical protein DFH08DRAFT_814921 [Mycena albidolilacea]|uniref:Uncharacterized protein n=1 Tax=Mycena albidolilacea TaxID=1033008 RepID=A0AAD6ZN40_9AGAR|nr:hypothetical protein DFH08DRAFT_814921 [Mycena albidolilacea]
MPPPKYMAAVTADVYAPRPTATTPSASAQSQQRTPRRPPPVSSRRRHALRLPQSVVRYLSAGGGAVNPLSTAGGDSEGAGYFFSSSSPSASTGPSDSDSRHSPPWMRHRADDVWETFTFSFPLEDTRRGVAVQEGLHVGAGAVAGGVEEGDRERESEREERQRQNNPVARHHHLDDTRTSRLGRLPPPLRPLKITNATPTLTDVRSLSVRTNAEVSRPLILCAPLARVKQTRVLLVRGARERGAALAETGVRSVSADAHSLGDGREQATSVTFTSLPILTAAASSSTSRPTTSSPTPTPAPSIAPAPPPSSFPPGDGPAFAHRAPRVRDGERACDGGGDARDVGGGRGVEDEGDRGTGHDAHCRERGTDEDASSPLLAQAQAAPASTDPRRTALLAVEDEGDYGMGEDAYCWKLGEPRDASFPGSAQAQVGLERGWSGRRDRRWEWEQWKARIGAGTESSLEQPDTQILGLLEALAPQRPPPSPPQPCKRGLCPVAWMSVGRSTRAPEDGDKCSFKLETERKEISCSAVRPYLTFCSLALLD